MSLRFLVETKRTLVSYSIPESKMTLAPEEYETGRIATTFGFILQPAGLLSQTEAPHRMVDLQWLRPKHRPT
jgi:hypothetical protein